MIRFNRASEFPTISTNPSVASIRDSQNQPYFPLRTSATGEFVLPFDLSYEVDFWGRVRRTVNAAREEAQATSADLATATLTIQAELAYDYFELRAADAQKQLLVDTVKAYNDALTLTKNRFEGGASPKSDVAQAQTQLDTTTAQETDIDVERAQYEHAIAVLLGKPPAEFSLAAESLRAQPPVIPVGLPSQLLERRPDIAAAERRIEEANEQIGIARAAFFPTVTLGATGGFGGTSILNWLNWPSRFWAVGPSLAETLFDAGRRRAGSDVAIAGYDAAVASLSANRVDCVSAGGRQSGCAAGSGERRKAAARRRCLCRGIAAALYQPISRWRRQLSSGHHGADDRADERALRDRYPAQAHGRERVAYQSPRRRLGHQQHAESAFAEEGLGSYSW